jgi:hypothetical protein
VVIAKVEAHIRNRDHGQTEVRVCRYEFEYDDPDDLRVTGSQWFEGNYRCDCNRRIFFLRAGSQLGPTDFPSFNPCGETEYTLVKLLIDGVEQEDYTQ